MNAPQPRCPSCDSIGRPSTHFCVVCGSRYQGPISGDLLALAARRQSMAQRQARCYPCDIPIRVGARFCPSCGAGLALDATRGSVTG